MSGEGDDWGGSPGVEQVSDHGVACIIQILSLHKLSQTISFQKKKTENKTVFI